MKIAFDLISDLHVETWPSEPDFFGQATSMLCLVAGDISRDRKKVVKTLKHLGQCYKAVFYIDGNDEHKNTLDDLGHSYRSLVKEIQNIPKVTFLQDHVAIADGVAFLGTNGWWTFDMDPNLDYDHSKQWFQDHYAIDATTVNNVETMALNDYAYLAKSVDRLQTHQDIKKIVILTHTVPNVNLIIHDIDLAGKYRLNSVGNSHMPKVLQKDTEHKVAVWCFGHYHNDIDSNIDGVRFVNNYRGRGNTPWSKSVYYPKRIELSF